MSRLPFTAGEFADRLTRVQTAMAPRGLDVLVLSAHANVYYLTGLWLNASVLNLLVVPAQGAPLLVVRWSDLLHARASPAPPEMRVYRRGVALSAKVVEILEELGAAHGAIGLELGHLPASEYRELVSLLAGADFQDASDLLEELRVIKSPSEVEYIRAAAEAVDAGMAALLGVAARGVNDSALVSAFYGAALGNGGDITATQPLIRTCRPGAPPKPSWWGAWLQDEDVIFCEPGIRVEGYHACLIRMIVVGRPTPQIQHLSEATAAAFDAMLSAMRPGMDVRTVHAAGYRVLEREGLSDVLLGRLGYGLGLSWPEARGFIAPDEDRTLQPGMVFHLQPYLDLVDQNLRFGLADTVVVTAQGAEALTRSPSLLHVC